MNIRSLRWVWLFVATAPAIAGDFDVMLSEIHYHPFERDEASREYVELFNGGGTAVDLSGWRFRDGIDFVFPDGTWIDPCSYLVVAADSTALFAAKPWIHVVGDFEGRLDNSGELLEIVNRDGEPIARVNFGDGGSWSAPSDGGGPSLELAVLWGDIDRPQVWVSSRRHGGTPGESNTRGPEEYPFAGIDERPLLRLNEVYPVGPGEGHIEIWNGGSAPLDLWGHVLVDDAGQTATVPQGTLLGPGGFAVLNAAAIGFSPQRDGAIALLAPDGVTFVDSIEVDVSAAGYARSRIPDGDPDTFVTPPSAGAPNSYVPEDRVVIHEVFFGARYERPSGACVRECSDRRQWIELRNRGTEAIDLSGWTLDRAVTHAFGPGTSIEAGGFIVVAAAPAAFKLDHPQVAVQPSGWTGSLGRREDTIILRDWLGNRVDRVRYGNGDPYNDLAPEDDRDDGTITVSDWPTDVADSDRSIELVSPWIENAAGRSWRLGPSRGTPGARNATELASPPPVVHDVTHAPAVPGSADHVVVTCRVHAASLVSSVDLQWKVEGAAGAPQSIAMQDDGFSGDGLAGDSVYGAVIPPNSHRSIISFQISVIAGDGATATYPIRPAVGNRTPVYLYEVDNDAPPANGSVNYRIIMSRADLNALTTRDVRSDVLLNATFIGDGSVHHMVGVRYRGENSRNLDRKAYTVRFPPDRKFQGLEFLNLNASNEVGNIELTGLFDFVAAELFRRAGVPYMQEWPVNLHFQGGVEGDNQGRQHLDPFYIRKEHFNRDFLSRYFKPDDRGNLYRARDPMSGVGTGNLSYRGEDPADYEPVYEKRSNRDANDYTDLIELTRALDAQETPDAQFVAEMYRLVDVREWGMFFAIQDFLTNNDGGIQTNSGEDYLLYRVPQDSLRENAGLWLLLPWDVEEIFTDSDAGFFITSVPAARRFLRHPEFAPYYLDGLDRLRREHATRRAMQESMAHADRIYPAAQAQQARTRVDDYVERRLELIAERVVTLLDAGIGSSGPSGDRIIAEGDSWRFWRGRSEPTAGSLFWADLGFSAPDWEDGASGFGYGDDDDATVLQGMRARFGNPGYLSVYIRKEFTVSDPNALSNLALGMDYDDAFVAYLNGLEVARSEGLQGASLENEPIPFDHEMGDQFNHEASAGDQGNPPETFPIPNWRQIILPGTNVLAIQGFNSTSDSSDFSLIPELLGAGAVSVAGAGWGSDLRVSGPSILIQGSASGSTARSIQVNGELAEVVARPPAGPPYGLFWRANVPLVPGPNAVRVDAWSGDGGTGYITDSMDLVIHRSDGGLVQVGGNLAAGAVWTRDGGPYHVTQGVTVPDGATLRIEAGAAVLLAPQATITVNGILDLAGTPSEPVTLRPAELNGWWGGIVLDGAGPHTLRNVELELGGSPQNSNGLISARNTSVVLESVKFRRLQEAALDIRDGRAEVRASSIEDAGAGILAQRSAVVVESSVLKGLTGDGISISGAGAERSRVQGCLISNVGDDGIELAGASADIVENRIESAANRGCFVNGDGTQGKSNVSWNVIHGCGVGLECADGIEPAGGEHDTLVFNRTGLLLNRYQRPDGVYGEFHSMIIWGNRASVEVEETSGVRLSWSDVGGARGMRPSDESMWPGEANILADPLFSDVGHGSFGLLPGSPCAGAGKDGTDIGAGAVTGPGTRQFLRGDVTGEEALNVTDAIVILNWLFLGGTAPVCEDAADVDDTGDANITDAIYLLNHLFLGGPPLAPPYPSPGLDTTPDDLECN